MIRVYLHQGIYHLDRRAKGKIMGSKPKYNVIIIYLFLINTLYAQNIPTIQNAVTTIYESLDIPDKKEHLQKISNLFENIYSASP